MTTATAKAALLGLVLSAPAHAHHGVAPHYDTSKPVTIEGVVARFEFINPHSFLYVDVVDSSGAKQTWTCEMASRTVLSRNGLGADSFKVGEAIKIDGVAARHNPTGCAFRVAYLPDGRTLRSTALFEPTRAADAPADPTSIVGIWTMKRFSVSSYEGLMTEAGERARAAFDPIKDDPAISCDPASPVRFWINVNEPFEIRRDGDDVLIVHRFMDATRVVHFDGRAPPASLPRSTMGYTAGHFDGQALVASTDHFVAATLEPRFGVRHTQDLKLTERLEVNRETGDLEITWTIDDPAYFKAPVTQKELYVRSPWDPEPYACKPGYRQ